MSRNVSDLLVERLSAWGIKRVFGYPGDGINGVIGALNRAGDTIDYVQARHEEMCALMACGHAKFTGEVGVCLATSGPGAVHLLNGLYDAKKDHQPVVALVGQKPLTALGSDYQQEIDLVSLFKDVAHEYVQQVGDAQQARHCIDRAIRIAHAERTVTCVIVPIDIQQEDAVDEPTHAHSAVGHADPVVVPHADQLERAAAVLNEGERVALLVGAGALHATDQIVAVAELLGAGVAKALLGKAAVPDDLPFVTGSLGLLGTRPSADMMSECDTLLMVGTNFPYAEHLPDPGNARAVQIDIDSRLIGIRYPAEVALVGDSRDTLAALAPLLTRKIDTAWREHIEDMVLTWREIVEARAMNDADPVNPQRVFYELSRRLPDNCIIAGDSGSGTNWYARDLQLRRGMMASLSGGLATMGSALPYAIAAKFAHPDRVVFALAGDGAMQMNGINELITIAKYWPRWSDPRLIVLVLNNRDLNEVTWEQRVMMGDPRFAASQDVPDVPYAEWARSLGLAGVRIDDPADVGPAWDEALAADRPFVLDAVVDPNVPPLPPHITLEQAKGFMASLAKEDSGRAGMVRQAVADKIEDFIHR